MTCFYPYYIDTGLFEGFKPPIRFIVPTLKTEYTTKRMYDAIMAEEKEVYIYGFLDWLRIAIQCVPLRMKHFIAEQLVGKGMEHFVGRSQEIFEAQQRQKQK